MDLNIKYKEEWVEKLWNWADENQIPDSVLPRNEEQLLAITSLSIGYFSGAFVQGIDSVISEPKPFNQAIMTVPKEIGNLINLTQLHIHSWKNGDLPKEIANLVNIEDLFITKTEITSLPKEIGKLTKIDELNLSSNNLESLPREIGNLINIRFLSLRANKLTNLPIEMENLVKLENIYLKENLFEDPLEVLKIFINKSNGLSRENLDIAI